MHEQRTRETRARAELALVRFAHELRDEAVFLVVLGGLVPEVLAADDGLIPEHLGTTDVDMLLITHIEPEADLGSVERALERIDFRPSETEDGWRWRGAVDGVPVKLEFLCDLPDHREHEVIRPRGCTKLAAMNLRGTGYVAHDFTQEHLTGDLADGTRVTVTVRFAGLDGYLLSKCVAVRTRAATKDYYDLAYVLLHNRAGGPEQAARGLLAGKLTSKLPALESTFVEIAERFGRTTDIGPRSYAEQSLEVEPDGDERLFRADAMDAVQRFLAPLRERGGAASPRRAA
jgi:hypothetical protein